MINDKFLGAERLIKHRKKNNFGGLWINVYHYGVLTHLRIVLTAEQLEEKPINVQ